MPNHLTINPTKFENMSSGKITYGHRSYDDTGETCQTVAFDPGYMIKNDLDFLKVCIENGPNSIFEEMLKNALDSETGLYIGSVWYDYDEIKNIIDPMEDWS